MGYSCCKPRSTGMDRDKVVDAARAALDLLDMAAAREEGGCCCATTVGWCPTCGPHDVRRALRAALDAECPAKPPTCPTCGSRDPKYITGKAVMCYDPFHNPARRTQGA